MELEAPRPAAQGASTTEVLIAKHRSGSTGRVELDFFAPYTLFANKHYDQPPPPDESTFRPRTDDAPVLSEDRDRPPPPGDDGGGLDDFEEFDEFEPGEPAGGPVSDQPETPTDTHPAPRATRPEAAAVAIGGSSASVSSATGGDAARATVAIGAIKVPSAEELRALSAAGVLQGAGGAPPGAAGGPGTLHTRRLPAIDLIRREPQVSADHPTLRDAFERPSPGLVGRARRVGPLVLLLALGVLAVAGWSLRGASSAEARAGTTVSEPVDTRISLPATQAIFGLTEDNKEAVLALCWRVSSNPNTECRRSYLRDTAEYPHREVAIPALDVDRDEVSNAAWDACERSGECPARDLDACRIYSVRGLSLSAELGESARSPDRPAVCVTHAEAEQFCEARGGRLPTVEEWERVARAGGELLQPSGAVLVARHDQLGRARHGRLPDPGAPGRPRVRRARRRVPRRRDLRRRAERARQRRRVGRSE